MLIRQNGSLAESGCITGRYFRRSNPSGCHPAFIRTPAGPVPSKSGSMLGMKTFLILVTQRSPVGGAEKEHVRHNEENVDHAHTTGTALT